MAGLAERLKVLQIVRCAAVDELDPMVHIGGGTAASPANEPISCQHDPSDSPPVGPRSRVGLETRGDLAGQECARAQQYGLGEILVLWIQKDCLVSSTHG
jgi:hypothetical protein